jgi:hypothetical protein
MLSTTLHRLAAATLTALLSALTPAHAKDLRVHAFECKTFGGKPIDLAFSLQNDSTTERMHLVCPIPDSSSFPKASIKTLNLHGFDNGGEFEGSTFVGVRAQLCTSAWHTTGGQCTPLYYVDNRVGDFTFQMLPRSNQAWTQGNFADFGYIHIMLPKKNANGRSTLRGYYLSDQPPF